MIGRLPAIMAIKDSGRDPRLGIPQPDGLGPAETVLTWTVRGQLGPVGPGNPGEI